MFRSLRLRLLLALSGMVLLVMALLGYFTSRATESEFQRYVEQDLFDYERLVIPFIVYKLDNYMKFRRVDCDQNLNNLLECQSDPIPYTSDILTDLQFFVSRLSTVSGTRIIVTDSADRMIANSDWGSQQKPDPPSLNREGAAGVLYLEGQTFFVFIDLNQSTGIGASQRAFLNSVNRSLVYGLVFAGLAAILLTIMLSRRILRPIEALTKASRAMGAGKLNQRVTIHTHDEIGELATAFNAMADGLSRQEQLRRNMVSDVAHELRTPLSNIRGYLEAIQDGLTDPTSDVINSLHEEAMLLNRLVDDLQELALVEAGQLHLRPIPVNLETIITGALIALQHRMNEKNIHLVTELSSTLPLLRVDPERIGQVLRNLLTNSITYTPEGGTITLRAYPIPTGVEVLIQDTGIGIAQEHLRNIFERFYRVDESRSRATGGAGLGLAIVKRLIQAHGGDINIESILGSGTTVTFTLPMTSA
ncbi:MAG: HAMP domain-containing protein [Anaerolineales bacterium]|nr:HAMP domain-containing protein [Anaerolineales bacterium]